MSRRSLHRRRPFAPKQTPISEAGVKADDGKWYVTMPGGDVIGCDIDARTGCLEFTRNGKPANSTTGAITDLYVINRDKKSVVHYSGKEIMYSEKK